MEAKCLIQHIRVRQEGVRYNSQLAAAIKMTHRAANQRLRRIQAGLHPIVERRVGDDHIKTTFHLGKDVAGKDFTFNTEAREAWVRKVDEMNGPYANPISLEMLEQPFWKEPSEYYGGQSFREAEANGLRNPSLNLVVTPQDAEADVIITAEMEAYVAGDQTMEQAVANIQKNLEAKIGTAQVK